MTDGDRLFARYAHGPNALGYCGPPARSGVPGLVDVALGEGEGVDVRALARRFSGAWPYQEVLAELAGAADPLGADVVRGYWTGNALTRSVDPAEFGRRLLERIAPQAGHYWAHLDESLLAEAAPTHLFHVVGVYPWSRLLGTGLPEPLQVIESCRIRVGRVVDVAGDRLRVEAERLEFVPGAGLVQADPDVEEVGWLVDGRPFADGIGVGTLVALHWGFACDRLDTEQAAELAHWTRRQLEASNPRLASADAPGAADAGG